MRPSGWAAFAATAMAVVCAAGCYSPSLDDCGFTCAASGGCPSGLSCVDGFCRASGATGSCSSGGGDGGGGDGDGGLGAADASRTDARVCAWPYEPSNIATCDIPDIDEDWVLGGLTDHLIDTASTQPFGAGDAPPHFEVVSQIDRVGPDVLMVVARDFTLEAENLVRVVGDKPLVIVALGQATIGGRIDVSARGGAAGAGSADDLCDRGAGSAVLWPGGSAEDYPGAGGGGGGGFALAGIPGQEGAPGCPGERCTFEGGPAGAGGSVSGNPELRPLRGGCAGGAGGAKSGTCLGGPAGGGGGAFQISARGILTLTGSIESGGGAGAPAGTGNVTCGGGGGGSGGAILLEGNTVELVTGSLLCANGGGGGSGGSGTPGGDGFCDFAPAQGGDPNGGDGGFIKADASCCPPYENGVKGGGGAGGQVGRLRINSALPLVDEGLQTTPPFTTNQ